MSGGSNKQQTQTQTSDPWAGQQPYLTDIFRQAKGQYAQGGPAFFPGSTVASFTPDQLQAQQMMRQAATGQSSQVAQNMGGASNFLLSGAVLDPRTNPYLQQSVNASMEPVTANFTQAVLPNIRAGATQAGQYGSTRQGIAEGLATQGLARTLGDISAKQYSQAYGQGLGEMGRALALAPQTIGASVAPAQQMDVLGRQLQMQDQAYLNDLMQRWNYYQNLPIEQLKRYSGFVQGGNYGGTQTTTTPGAQANPIGSALGGAAMGFSMGGGYGALAGGLAGLASAYM